MKRIITALVALVCTTCAFAQFPGGQMPEFKPEDMAARQADRIMETCGIDSVQYKKVLDIFLQGAKEQQEMMKKMQAGEQPNFDPESFQKRREAQTKALKEILTEEQYKKYDEEQQKMRERMMQGGGFGGFGGPQQ